MQPFTTFISCENFNPTDLHPELGLLHFLLELLALLLPLRHRIPGKRSKRSFKVAKRPKLRSLKQTSFPRSPSAWPRSPPAAWPSPPPPSSVGSFAPPAAPSARSAASPAPLGQPEFGRHIPLFNFKRKANKSGLLIARLIKVVS